MTTPLVYLKFSTCHVHTTTVDQFFFYLVNHFLCFTIFSREHTNEAKKRSFQIWVCTYVCTYVLYEVKIKWKISRIVYIQSSMVDHANRFIVQTRTISFRALRRRVFELFSLSIGQFRWFKNDDIICRFLRVAWRLPYLWAGRMKEREKDGNSEVEKSVGVNATSLLAPSAISPIYTRTHITSFFLSPPSYNHTHAYTPTHARIVHLLEFLFCILLLLS